MFKEVGSNKRLPKLLRTYKIYCKYLLLGQIQQEDFQRLVQKVLKTSNSTHATRVTTSASSFENAGHTIEVTSFNKIVTQKLTISGGLCKKVYNADFHLLIDTMC